MGTYLLADQFTPGTPVGHMDFELQVSNTLVIKLGPVKVTSLPRFHTLIWCVILDGDGEIFGRCALDMAGTLRLVHLEEDTHYISHLTPFDGDAPLDR